MLSDDAAVTYEAIQRLRDPEAVTRFFTTLDYRVSMGLSQATMDALKKEIHASVELQRKIEVFRQVVRYEEGATHSFFYVYLYVLPTLTSKTIADIFHDLAGRHGDFLALVTNRDWSELDFLYVDREAGAPQQVTQPELFSFDAPSSRKVGKPLKRVLAVDRLKPSKVDLRVLNRFRWPRQRSIATQCTVLHNAYDTAEWSEDFFNNRALFSDHYLNVIMRTQNDWMQTTGKHPDARLFSNALESLRATYDDAQETLADLPAPELQQRLIDEVLSQLDFFDPAAARNKPSKAGGRRKADYLLYTKDAKEKKDKPAALCLAYEWNRNLDGYADEVDDLGVKEIGPTALENPGAVVVTLLEQEEVDWAFLTNGKTWRLYSAKAHNRATNYYEIDLEETLAIPRDQGDDAKVAFRYFWLLFRAPAFIPATHDNDENVTFLDYVLRQSSEYALELEASLKKKIFDDVFRYFARGLVRYAQDVTHTLPAPEKMAAPEVIEQHPQLLKPFFDSTLTFLYRLLFLLYAESRNLLPVYERIDYYPHSLTKLKGEIANELDKKSSQVLGNIEDKYARDSYELYKKLNALFRVVDQGKDEWNVPTYNGGLFVTQVAQRDLTGLDEDGRPLIMSATPEEILQEHMINDYDLVLGLDKLARDEDKKQHALVNIDYKSLGVRQLGSIYEGLLEFKLRYTLEEMVVIGKDKKELIIPLREAVASGQYKPGKTLTFQPQFDPVYIENDRHERKATGSYYTPDYIVEYIVAHTVGPVMDEKARQLENEFRLCSDDITKKQKNNRQLKEQGNNPDSLDTIYNKYKSLVDKFFDVKVLDPAMGSGHFLVETVDYITRRMLQFLNRFPLNPIRKELDDIRTEILESMERQHIRIDHNKLNDINLLKRQVLKRCIYGVDLNKMAVELAKVSVWLDSFTVGAPLSFLNHHLRWGNSLLGTRINDLRNAIETGQPSLLFGNSMWVTALLATRAMIEVGRSGDSTIEQARDSQGKYQEALKELEPYKRVFDIYLSRWYGNTVIKGKGGRADVDKALDFLRNPVSETWVKQPEKAELDEEQKRVVEIARKAFEASRFFHWDLEFPEVFIDLKLAEVKKDGGFDAVVGNPPYVRQEGLGNDKAAFQALYTVFNSIADLYTYFIERGNSLLRPNGHFGMITANKFVRANYGVALRFYLTEKVKLERLIDFGDLPVFGDATTYPIIILSSKADRNSSLIEYVLLKSLPFENLNSIIKSAVNQIPESSFEGTNWTLATNAGQVILDKLKSSSITLSEYVGGKIRYGIKTGLNEAFVIDYETRSKLIAEDSRSADIIKPFLVGEDVRRYSLGFQNRYLIWTYVGVPIDKYPAIYKHLRHYQIKLEQRSDKGKYWWELRPCDYYTDFETPKIIYPNICMQPEFTYDDAKFYSNQKTFIIPGSDYYLLATLNSKITKFVFEMTLPKLRGGFFEPGYVFMKDIPIRRINFTNSEEQRKNYLEGYKYSYSQYINMGGYREAHSHARRAPSFAAAGRIRCCA